MTLIEKAKSILGSIRFWEITGGAASQIVKLYFPELEPLCNIVTFWLVGVATIGTIDKLPKALKQ